MASKPTEGSQPVDSSDPNSITISTRDDLADASPRRGASNQRRVEQATEWLFSAACPPWSHSPPEIFAQLAAYHVTIDDMIDHCIPEAAREMGRRWLRDGMPFTDVTLGSANLMHLAHHLLGHWQSRGVHEVNARSLLIVTCKGEQHILGPQILASQLRRRGHSVRFMGGSEASQVIEQLEQDPYQAVLVSSGSWATFDDANRMIAELESTRHAAPHVILGGAAIEQIPDARAKSAARWITNDVDTALKSLVVPGQSDDLKAGK